MWRSLQYYFEYAVLRIVAWTVRLFPRSIRLWLGRRLGMLLYRSGFYRRIVRLNMECVGLWDEKEQQRITRKLYRILGCYAMDFLCPPSQDVPCIIEHEEVLEQQLAAGRGIVVLMAHFGNWEILPRIFAGHVERITAAVKPMRNPQVDRWLVQMRKQNSLFVLPPKMAVYRGLRILKEGGVIAFLIDQYAGSMGTPAPFLGQTTSSVRTVAGLAHRTGCGVIGVYALMQDDGTYRTVLQDVPLPENLPEDRNAAVSLVQAQHNQILSDWIVAHPEHWFGWFHRRFKDVISYQRTDSNHNTASGAGKEVKEHANSVD